MLAELAIAIRVTHTLASLVCAEGEAVLQCDARRQKA